MPAVTVLVLVSVSAVPVPVSIVISLSSVATGWWGRTRIDVQYAGFVFQKLVPVRALVVALAVLVVGGAMARVMAPLMRMLAPLVFSLGPNPRTFLLPPPPLLLVVSALLLPLPLALLCKVRRHGIVQIVVGAFILILILVSVSNRLRCGIQTLVLRLGPLSILIFSSRLLILGHMIHPQRPAQHLGAVQIVHRQHGGSLILVHHKSKPSMLRPAPFSWLAVVHLGPAARFLLTIVALRGIRGGGGCGCTGEVDIDHLAVLRKDGDDIAFGKLVCQSSDKDVGRIAVLLVPRRGRVGDGDVEFGLVDAVDLAHHVHLVSASLVSLVSLVRLTVDARLARSPLGVGDGDGLVSSGVESGDRKSVESGVEIFLLKIGMAVCVCVGYKEPLLGAVEPRLGGCGAVGL